MAYIEFSKKVYLPKSPPQKIDKIEFLVPSSTDIAKASEVQIYESKLYRLPERTPHTGGVLDPRLGTSSKGAVCETCQQSLQDCAGHFGYIQLQLPLFHIGYLNYTIKILQTICKSCSRVLLFPTEREDFQKKLRNPRLEESAKKAIFKKIHARCKSTGNQTKFCPFCGSENAVVKKAGGAYKIMHDKFRNKTEELKQTEFAQALIYNDTIEKFLPKVPLPSKSVISLFLQMTDDLNPLRVLHLFQNIPDEDVEFLCLGCRPENLIMTCLPVPPVCIRPSVEMEGSGSNEDDITIKLTQILDYNSRLRIGFEQGIGITSVMEIWDAMQNEFAVVINSDLPGLSSLLQPQRKVRGYVQRLKGKQGRFRGNLSGKRVDFSGRTVISPDPNLAIDELAVPLHIATTLTYPDRVSTHNLELLQNKILTGQFDHPGANWVIKEDGVKYTLRFADRRKIARELKPGDVVERHLKDGDIVLFNRQPSLHRVSMMAHKVKVRPWRTFSFNECVCSPYNADFDGDEMNLHLPQTEEARAEARMLMSTENNLCSPKNGQLLISATQDFLTCAYLITSKDVYFTRSQMGLYCCAMCNALQRIDLPVPALMKPMELWSGKQLIDVLLRPNAKCKVVVNLEMKEKFYSRTAEHLCPEDGYVHFLNSQLISGQLGKNVLGGDPGGLFGVLKNDYSGRTSAVVMSRLAKLSARYMGERGFSIGLEDVTPSHWLQQETQHRIQESYSHCDELIQHFKEGTLQSNPGMTEEETLEARVTSVLNNIRSDAGKLCMQSLDFHNSALIMSRCGAKGSPINIAQMIACVGQQMVNGTRAPNGFSNRCLPHFSKGDKTPQGKGFVANSFYTGLSPTEFFFHAMAGREGLVDTAVKTAETGYMSRRLVKALEDLFVHYDQTVRDSASSIVQMKYGDDGLDPPKMEASNGRPVNLERLMNTVQSKTKRAGPGLREAKVPLPNDLEILIESIKTNPESLIDNRTSLPIRGLFTPLVRTELGKFVDSKLEGYRQTRRRLGLVDDVRGDPRLEYLSALDGFTSEELSRFLQGLIRKYEDKMIDPGSTVGAIAAQSIGEPGTQMTLKTFHFAGIGSMQVTQGVPRIKEIINASKNISTPVITAELASNDSRIFAHLVKGRIERTTIEDISKRITATRTLEAYIVVVELNLQVISLLELDIDCYSIRQSILDDEMLRLRNSGVKVESNSKLTINLFESDIIIASEELILDLERLEKAVPKVTVHGLSNVDRVMVQRSSHYLTPDKEKFTLLAEGNCLLEVMGIPGVNGPQTTTNHVMECEKVLGIEAARSKIISEIEDSMNAYGMVVDHRHTMLLADCMTYKGEVLGINRTGIGQMKESVLHAASFEKTADHLFDAAIHGRVDNISGVSESIIMGNPMPTGTGMFNLIYHDKEMDNEELNRRSDPIFKQT